jgi:hypothetical protein
MASKKEGISKENRIHLRDEIHSLLSNIKSDVQQNDLVVDDKFSTELKKESPYDFEEISTQFTKKAKEITDSLFKNYVDIGIFEENDYARHKKEIDTINISNFFFQLKTIKMTIIKVMEEITSGNTHPRLIEVMGQLQDKMAAITKMQANYIIFLEESYQKLNNDKPVNSNFEKISSSSSEGQFFVTIGTKNMIKSLPIDASSSEAPKNNLVNPGLKADLMKEKNIQIKLEDSEDYLDISEML